MKFPLLAHASREIDLVVCGHQILIPKEKHLVFVKKFFHHG
jgi:hypothetical protein